MQFSVDYVETHPILGEHSEPKVRKNKGRCKRKPHIRHNIVLLPTNPPSASLPPATTIKNLQQPLMPSHYPLRPNHPLHTPTTRTPHAPPTSPNVKIAPKPPHNHPKQKPPRTHPHKPFPTNNAHQTNTNSLANPKTKPYLCTHTTNL